MNGSRRLPAPELPRQQLVALVTLEQLHGYLPEHYIALVHALGNTPHEALLELEARAQNRARANRVDALRDHQPVGGTYVVLGLRMVAGINSSGEPQWLAYGTLTRGHRSFGLVPTDDGASAGSQVPR